MLVWLGQQAAGAHWEDEMISMCAGRNMKTPVACVCVPCMLTDLASRLCIALHALMYMPKNAYKHTPVCARTNACMRFLHRRRRAQPWKKPRPRMVLEGRAGWQQPRRLRQQLL